MTVFLLWEPENRTWSAWRAISSNLTGQLITRAHATADGAEVAARAWAEREHITIRKMLWEGRTAARAPGPYSRQEGMTVFLLWEPENRTWSAWRAISSNLTGQLITRAHATADGAEVAARAWAEREHITIHKMLWERTAGVAS